MTIMQSLRHSIKFDVLSNITSYTSLISTRSISRIDLKRHKLPHKEKAIALMITKEKFKYPLVDLPTTETCLNSVKIKYAKNQEEDNQFERILARELLEEVKKSEMVVMLHQHPCTENNRFDMRVKAHRKNMKLLWYDYKIPKIAFKDTKYSNLKSLCIENTSVMLNYDKDVKKLLKLEKKLPYVTIMCAFMDDRILSLAELHRIAELPNIDSMRASLCYTLGQQAQHLTSQLNHHQTDLSSSLKRYYDANEQSK